MTLNRLRSALRRRVRYRITRAGALYLLAVLFTGAAAFLSGNNLLFLLFSAMLALFLVSGFVSRLVLAGLELELLLPEHVAARMPTAARIRLRNLKRLTPSFSIELSGQPGGSGRLPPILTRPLYFPVIPGRGVVEAGADAGVQVVFPVRGRHRENLFSIATDFPFGFLRKSTTVALHRDTLVYPSLKPSARMELLLESIAGEIESRSRGDGRDFYRIRAYEAHDAARHIDWKSSAHTGNLHVREFTRDENPTVEIFLDRRLPPNRSAEDDERFEELVENCAFLVWKLADRDSRMLLRSQQFSLAIPDEGEVWDALKFLALAEPVASADFGDRPPEPLDAASLWIPFRVQPAPILPEGENLNARAAHDGINFRSPQVFPGTADK